MQVGETVSVAETVSLDETSWSREMVRARATRPVGETAPWFAQLSGLGLRPLRSQDERTRNQVTPVGPTMAAPTRAAPARSG